jgi:hypothetical protein
MITEALARALRSQFHPKMLGLALWPMLGALLLWIVLASLFWHAMYAQLMQWTEFAPVAAFLNDYSLSWIPGILFWLLSLFVMPLLVVTTAIFITSTIAMPIAVEHVARNDYPGLALGRGGSIWGSVWNGLAALIVYIALWLITLPLWLVLPFTAIIPLALAGYLNSRIFRYDALAEHATPEEYRQIIERCGTSLYGLGCVASAMQLVPLVNLITPVYSGLSFIHFGLAELERLRAGAVSGTKQTYIPR